MEALLGLLSLAYMVFGIVAVWGCIYWVLGPLDRAAKNRQYPVQFSLADLLCLFVLIQLPLGGVKWAARGSEFDAGVVIFGLVVCVVAGTVWWTCVRTLSRAGIHVVWHRSVALAIVMPVTYVGTITVISLPVGAVGLLEQRETAAAVWLLLAEIPLCGVLYGLRRFTRAIVAAAEARRNGGRDEDAIRNDK